VERAAEALSAEAITPLEGWYPKADTAREMADGTFLSAETDRHPHPIAEAIRWQICEAELVQIIGRARGINRTATNPVDILVMTDVPLPLPVNELISADELAPSPCDLMLAAGGVAFGNATDASLAYPQLWGNGRAAAKAFERGGLRHSLIRQYLLGNVANLGILSYKRRGRGCSPTLAVFDPALIPNPVTTLTEKFGELAWSKIEMPQVEDAQEMPIQNDYRELRHPKPMAHISSAPISPSEIARMSDDEKLAIRARLQGGQRTPAGSPAVSAGGYGRLFPPAAMLRSTIRDAPVETFCTIKASNEWLDVLELVEPTLPAWLSAGWTWHTATATATG
jgi:hypothetical protein